MDHLLLKERENDEDIEIGGGSSVEEGDNDNQIRNFSGGVLNGISSICRLVTSTRLGGVASDGCVNSLSDKNAEGEVGRSLMDSADDKQKTKGSRKPSKPPRPPKGPTLDAADQKLVREITELAMRRRARMERVKALKKMRAEKSSSWGSSLSAMIITILVCLIILLQGISSKDGGSMLTLGAPAPAAFASEGLISVHHFRNFPAFQNYAPGSSYPVSASEQASISGLRKR